MQTYYLVVFQILTTITPSLFTPGPEGSKNGAMGNSSEIRKMLGEPMPQVLNPKDLPPEIAAYFARGGLLDRLKKKLALISRKKGGKIIPAKNTIACVDDEDNVYVGVDFLQNFGEDDALVGGILAHEWGHMMSDMPKGVDWSHLTWDEIFEMRRDEEGDADGFAGRALCLMGYDPEKMIEFLAVNDKRRKEKKLPSHKYHNHATRAAIIRESYKAEENAIEVARKIFFQGKDSVGAKVGRVIGAG